MAASRDFLLVSGGRIVTALVALLSIRYATSLLSPGQYGELALLVAVQVFCGLFLINPVGQFINRQTHAWWDSGTLLARLRTYRLYVFGVAIIGAAAVALVGAQPAGVPTLLAVLTMTAMVVAATWNATSVPLLNMLGFRAASVGWASVTVLAGLFFSLLLTRIAPSALAWFAGQAMGLAVGALGAGRALRRCAQAAGHVMQPLSLVDRKTLLTYCLPLAVATGFMWLQLSGWRFLMQHYWGLAQLGYAAVGLSLASQLWGMVESLAMQFLNPFFYRRISVMEASHAADVFSDFLNVQGPIYIVLAGATVCGATSLLHVLAHAQYAGAGAFVMLGALIECCRVLGNLFGNVAQVTRRTRALALPYGCGALTLALLMILAGITGAPIAWAAVALATGAVVMLVVMASVMYRQLPFVPDGRRWLLSLLCLCLFLLMAVMMQAPGALESALGRLACIGLASAGMVFFLLWKNPALQRLLQVSLDKREGDA